MNLNVGREGGRGAFPVHPRAPLEFIMRDAAERVVSAHAAAAAVLVIRRLESMQKSCTRHAGERGGEVHASRCLGPARGSAGRPAPGKTRPDRLIGVPIMQ